MRHEHRIAESVIVIILVAGLAGTVMLLTDARSAAASGAALSGNGHVLTQDVQSLLVGDALPFSATPEVLASELAEALEHGTATASGARFRNPYSHSSAIIVGDLNDVPTEHAPAVFVSDDQALWEAGRDGARTRLAALSGALVVAVDPGGHSLGIFWITKSGERSDAVATLFL